MPRSNKYNKSYGLSNPLQDIFPEPVVAQRSPTTSDVGYRIGQTWVDQSTGQIYGLASVNAGSATWSILGPGASDVDTLTGDTGGAISPTAGNINILGGDGLTVSGAGSTLTINRDAEGGYPITPYVVGPSGQAGYTTIQSALDAIGAGNSGQIWVQPGTYTENLIFPNGINVGIITGSDENAGAAEIVGMHTPPETGNVVLWRMKMTSTTHIFNSNAAGSSALVCAHNNYDTNGYIFNLPNWTSSGTLTTFAIGDFLSTSDGIVNNTGGASVFLFQSGLGVGTTNPCILSGFTAIQLMDINCPVNIQGGADCQIEYSTFFQPITLSGTSSGYITSCRIASGADAALTYSTSGNFEISGVNLNSSNNPAIAGIGTGTLNLTGISFVDNAVIGSSLTIAGGTTSSGSFNTLDQAAGLTISGNDIDADGTDANISIIVSPKGTGDFVVDVGDIQNTAGDIIATHSSAGADVTVEATNSDNTSATSRAGFEAAVGGTSSGDPYVNFLISGGQTFTMGIDNSTTNDDFVISDSAALGTTNRLSIDGSTGLMTLSNGLTVTGTTSINPTGSAVTNIGNAAGGNVNIASAQTVAIDADLASNFTVDGADSLTINSTNGPLILEGGETDATAVQITSTNASGGVTISAGTSNVNISGNLVLSDVATQLRMNGGAATDFIGTTTLVAGTVTVGNTNIAATDRIFIQRQSVNSSTAIGNLTYSISAGASFTITSVQDASPGTTETNDVSIVMYHIIRQF